MDQPQAPLPEDSEGKAGKPPLKRFREVAEVFVIELYVLVTGLLIGYFWTWGNRNDQLLETFDIIVGLCIVIVCMIRFLCLARALGEDEPLRMATLKFFKELLLLLVGLLLGSLWYLYFEQTDQFSTHFLVLLILIIIIFARYIALVLPRSSASDDDDID